LEGKDNTASHPFPLPPPPFADDDLKHARGSHRLPTEGSRKLARGCRRSTVLTFIHAGGHRLRF